LGKNDYFDYYQNRNVFAGIRHAFPAKNSEVVFEFGSGDHLSLSKNSDGTFINDKQSQRLNPEIDDGRLNYVSAAYSYDELYGLPGEARLGDLSSYNRINLKIEHSSSKYFGSDFDFTQVSLMADYTLKTFFRRRPDANYARMRVDISSYTGELPLQKYCIIDANLFSYAPFGIFKTRNNIPLQGDKKAALFWEYNTRSIPFEILGLSVLSRNKYEFLVHGASGRTWIDHPEPKQSAHYFNHFYEDNMHNELGMGLKIKYKFISLRLDLTRDMRSGMDYFGFTAKLIGLTF
jgi:hypothetical protein